MRESNVWNHSPKSSTDAVIIISINRRRNFQSEEASWSQNFTWCKNHNLNQASSRDCPVLNSRQSWTSFRFKFNRRKGSALRKVYITQHLNWWRNNNVHYASLKERPFQSVIISILIQMEPMKMIYTQKGISHPRFQPMQGRSQMSNFSLKTHWLRFIPILINCQTQLISIFLFQYPFAMTNPNHLLFGSVSGETTLKCSRGIPGRCEIYESTDKSKKAQRSEIRKSLVRFVPSSNKPVHMPHPNQIHNWNRVERSSISAHNFEYFALPPLLFSDHLSTN
jgi:hypothetical protein